MNATDEMRETHGSLRGVFENGWPKGDFAVVDGELYAIERRNWWPADYSPTDVDWRLVPPSGETAE